MGEWLSEFLREAPAHDFPIFTPYYELTQEQKDYLWHGPREKVCIDSFFKMLEETSTRSSTGSCSPVTGEKPSARPVTEDA